MNTGSLTTAKTEKTIYQNIFLFKHKKNSKKLQCFLATGTCLLVFYKGNGYRIKLSVGLVDRKHAVEVDRQGSI